MVATLGSFDAFTAFQLATSNTERRVEAFVNRESVQREIDNFIAVFPTVRSGEDLFRNDPDTFRARNFILRAFEADEFVNQQAILRKAFEVPISFGPGLANPENIANRLNDPALLELVRVLDYGGRGEAIADDVAVRDEIIRRNLSLTLEEEAAGGNEGARLALKATRVLPTITSGLEILGDRDLLEVARIITGLAPEALGGNLENLASFFEREFNLNQTQADGTPVTSDFQDGSKLTQRINQFLIRYDAENGTGLNLNTPAGAAAQILTGFVPLVNAFDEDGAFIPPPLLNIDPLTLEAAFFIGA